MTDSESLAADGRALPTAYTFGQFIQMMEDGELHGELSDALQKINAAMANHALDFGGKPKGKMTLTIDFTLDKGVFEIRGDYAVKLPTPPRGKTVVWGTQDNRFTPQNPKQMHLFGVREVATAGEAGQVRKT
jgi:hypothetical protein